MSETKTFLLEIVSPERKVFSGDVEFGVFPGAEGEFGVLPNHAAMLSALKPGRGGSVVLRVYEAAGRPSSGVKIKLNAGISSAREVSLLEDGGAELKVVDDTLQLQP